MIEALLYIINMYTCYTVLYSTYMNYSSCLHGCKENEIKNDDVTNQGYALYSTSTSNVM